MVPRYTHVALVSPRTYLRTTPKGFPGPSHEKTRRQFQLPVPWLQNHPTFVPVVSGHVNATPHDSGRMAENTLRARSFSPPASNESKLIVLFSIGSDRNTRQISLSKD